MKQSDMRAYQTRKKLASRMLREFMATTGLSTVELARRLNVHRGVVSRWKHGASLPNIPHAVMLERFSGGLLPAAAMVSGIESHRVIPKWELVKLLRAEREKQMSGTADDKFIDIYSAQDENYAPVIGQD